MYWLKQSDLHLDGEMAKASVNQATSFDVLRGESLWDPRHTLTLGAVANDVGIDCGAFSGGVKVSAQAARSMGGSVGFSARVGQPSTFLIVIWPEARSAQNSIAAVSAEGRTVWVLIRRLNSSCRRSTAFVVRADFHWLGGRRVKVNSLSPASSRLS